MVVSQSEVKALSFKTYACGFQARNLSFDVTNGHSKKQSEMQKKKTVWSCTNVQLYR